MLAGIITFTDKVIDEDTANDVRRAIGMTKIGMIIEREKEGAVMEERRKTEAARKKIRDGDASGQRTVPGQDR